MKVQDLHALLLNPAAALCGISECRSANGNPWSVAKAGKCRENQANRRRGQLHNKIHVNCSTPVSICIDCQSANKNETYISFVQRPDDGFQTCDLQASPFPIIAPVTD